MTLRIGWLWVIAVAFAAPAWGQNGGGTEGPSLLGIFWKGLEVPSWFIFAGSFVAIMLIVEHFVTVRTASIAPPEEQKKARKLIEKRAYRECIDSMQKSPTFFARTMNAALQHARHGFDAMHEAAIEKSGEMSGRMYRKVEYLNILGNLGPLLGLLGTVWGMIEAFGSLSQGGGESNAAGLADGISKALVNTALGLMLAIIGLGFFGICRNRIESLTVASTVEVLNLLEYFRPSAAQPARGDAARSAARPTAEKRPAGKSVPPPPAPAPAPSPGKG